MGVLTLTIATTPQTSNVQLGSFEIVETANGRNTLTALIKSENGSYRPALDAEVIACDDATTIFGGTIRIPIEQGLGGKPIWGIATRIECVDFNAFCDQRYVKEDIAAGQNLIQVLTTLVAYLAAFGVSLDAGQAAWGTLPAFSWHYKKLSEALNELSTVTGWPWNIDYSKHLRMFEPGTLTPAFPITDALITKTNLDIQVVPSRTNYANRIILICGSGTGTDSENMTVSQGVSSGGYTRWTPLASVEWNCSQNINDVWPNELVVNAVNQGPISWGFDVSFAWWWDYTTHQLVYTESFGQIPYAPTDVITIGPFTIIYPFVYIAEDSGEQTLHGIWEQVVSVPDCLDDETAEVLGAGYLAMRLPVPKVVTYQTLLGGVAPGQTQSIQVSARNINNTFLIMEVRTRLLIGGILIRTVKAIEGTTYQDVYQGSWRDVYKQWSGGAGTSGAMVISGGGGGGTGIAKTGYFLGGSAIEPVTSPAPTWVSASDGAVQISLNTVARGSTSARVTVRLKARSAGVSVTARLQNISDGLTVGTSAVVTSTSWTTVTFGATLTPGTKIYELQVLPSAAHEPVYGVGYLE